MSALAADDLVVRYRSGRTFIEAVAGVTFEIAPGLTLGLVGESGSGKSTIARAVVGLVPVSSGTIRINGRQVGEPVPRRWRRGGRTRHDVQMVFQDPNSTLNPRLTVGSALGEAANVLPREHRYTVRDLMALVELSENLADRFPHQLSGGQRQRVAIARALAVRPTVLVADEITASLDVSVQASVLNLMGKLRRELEITCLFISHNLAVVRHIADEVAVMKDGRLVEKGPAETLLDDPQDPYTRRLLAAVPRVAYAPRRTLSTPTEEYK